MERQKVEAEHADLREKIEYLESLLADDDKVYGVIKDELAEVKAAHSGPVAQKKARGRSENLDPEIDA